MATCYYCMNSARTAARIGCDCCEIERRAKTDGHIIRAILLLIVAAMVGVGFIAYCDLYPESPRRNIVWHDRGG